MSLWTSWRNLQSKYTWYMGRRP